MSILLVLVLPAIASGRPAPPFAGKDTIFFDDQGAETGITNLGTTDFSLFGSNWTGGTVTTVGVPSLYASTPAAYRVEPGETGTVTFDEPVDSASFFFVTELLATPSATAFNAEGTPLGSVESLHATVLGDPANFRTLDPEDDIAWIEFDGASWVDDFSFSQTGIEPPPPVAEASITLGDKVMGELGPDGTHLLRFDAVAGTRVSFTVTCKSGGCEPALRLFDPRGAETIAATESVVSSKKARIAKLELAETGEHMLEIIDTGPQVGSYRLVSKRAVPKIPKQVVEIAPPADTPVCVPFDAVAGGTLKKLLLKSLKAKGDFALTGGQPAALLPQLVALHAPGVGPLDLTDLVLTSPSGKKLSATAVPLPETGAYVVEVDGSDGSVGFARLSLKIKTPKGKTTHELPAPAP